MKKQFDVLEQINILIAESNSRIKELNDAIHSEVSKIKESLISAYNHNEEVLYLVNFGSYSLDFYKATKSRLHEVKISWYDSDKKRGYKFPTTYNDAVECLASYNNPTNCEILSYRSFGYFDDLQKKYLREDWIAESIRDKDFLYEINQIEFQRAIQIVYDFYTSNTNQ